MSKETTEEPVAKNLRDIYGVLSDLKQHIQKTYGSREDWASLYVTHQKAILTLPKFKSVTDIITQMTPDLLRGKMKYAMGDYQKQREPPPPAPRQPPPAEDDALADFFRGMTRIGSMEARMAECERVRQSLKGTGKTADAFAKELRDETARIARIKEAPARAYDARADVAREAKREAKARAETEALRAISTYAPGERGAFGSKKK